MSVSVLYGLGGLCDPCDETHDHPLNNLIEVKDLSIDVELSTTDYIQE